MRIGVAMARITIGWRGFEVCERVCIDVTLDTRNVNMFTRDLE